MNLVENGDYHVVFKHEEWEFRCKWDGCIEVIRYWNGTTTQEDGDYDQIHVCEVDKFIDMMMDLKIARDRYFPQ